MYKNYSNYSVSYSNNCNVRECMHLYSGCSGLQCLADGFSDYHDYYCPKNITLYSVSGKAVKAYRFPPTVQAFACMAGILLALSYVCSPVTPRIPCLSVELKGTQAHVLYFSVLKDGYLKSALIFLLLAQGIESRHCVFPKKTVFVSD